MFFHPVMQVSLGSLVTPSNKLLRGPIGQQRLDFLPKRVSSLLLPGPLGLPSFIPAAFLARSASVVR